jgi:hypothetical protein
MALDSGGSRIGMGGLVSSLIGELETAKLLILSLDDETYSIPEDDAGSVGAHVRHDLNFVECVLNGLESGIVDYTQRVRDRRLERDRKFAAERIEEVIDTLKSLNVDPRTVLFVVSEIDASLLHRSTVSRELEFVLSHTVHHHAIIKQKLKDAAPNVDQAFGVAPSTLEYWRQAGR